jgi:hypothetical protein
MEGGNIMTQDDKLVREVVRLDLPNEYWLKKEDDNGWWLGRGRMNLALKIVPSVPCGKGGSIDSAVKEFVRLMWEVR